MPLGTVPTGTSIPITGSGAVTLEGHPIVTTGTDVENVPVTSTVKYFGITDDAANPTPRRQKVDIKRCDNCHEKLSLHGANRNDNPQVCVVCHNPNATDISQRPADPTTALDGKVEEAIDFKYMIHKIHDANIVVYGYGGNVHDFTRRKVPSAA